MAAVKRHNARAAKSLAQRTETGFGAWCKWSLKYCSNGIFLEGGG